MQVAVLEASAPAGPPVPLIVQPDLDVPWSPVKPDEISSRRVRALKFGAVPIRLSEQPLEHIGGPALPLIPQNGQLVHRRLIQPTTDPTAAFRLPASALAAGFDEGHVVLPRASHCD